MPEKFFFLVLTALAFIIFFLLKKKISYWFTPNEVISYYLKKTLVGINVFFAFIFAAFLHTLLIDFLDVDQYLDKFPLIRIAVIVFEIILFITIIGLAIEKYLILFNRDFKEWKHKKETN